MRETTKPPNLSTLGLNVIRLTYNWNLRRWKIEEQKQFGQVEGVLDCKGHTKKTISRQSECNEIQEIALFVVNNVKEIITNLLIPFFL